MKRIFLTLLFFVLFTALPAPAFAQTFNQTSDFAEPLAKPKAAQTTPKPKPKAPASVPKPEPVIYTVADGDNLSTIGTATNTEWQRIWAKNSQLANPDVVLVGQQITIPTPAEQLSRELPANVALPATTPGVVTTPKTSPPGVSINDPGNTYDYGYCTWYVKNRRGSSLPNSLGNANTWYYRAQSLGMAVGSAPRAGAVGTTTAGALGHVVYVESVNSNGSINISEMNYQSFAIVSSRTTSASEFLYIY